MATLKQITMTAIFEAVQARPQGSPRVGKRLFWRSWGMGRGLCGWERKNVFVGEMGQTIDSEVHRKRKKV